MGTVNFTEKFKRDAVAQVTERGYPVKEVSERLDVSTHSLCAWKHKHAHDGMLSPIEFERQQKLNNQGV
ncbi:transposase [Donghicola sp. C2-DW-16]|uniref:Transposase n=2 Tax=Donghicola mangrovi TaxID=2729614 RepID=A0ABX2PI08_9RHOB|nr:transposase [Donghicola mangrovi]NVO29142.1 transposase [Donghicola mangrovi]